MTKRLEKIPNVLKFFAVVLLLSGLFGCGLLYDLAQRDDFDRDFSVFILVSMMGHSFIGFAILSRKRWGFVVFKCYLYILFLAIPVGTYISYKTLQYLKKNYIESIYR